MKPFISTILTSILVCSLMGCKTRTLPQPDYPLQEDEILAAIDHTDLPQFISGPETHSNLDGHIAYTLREPTVESAKDSGDTEKEKMAASVSSALTEGERFLNVTLPSPYGEALTHPFAWEDQKQQIIFATLLYGGFEDEEAVYQVFSNKELPGDKDSYEWEEQFPGGYCRVEYRLYDSIVVRSSIMGRSVPEKFYYLSITFYESRALYERLQKMLDQMRIDNAVET